MNEFAKTGLCLLGAALLAAVAALAGPKAVKNDLFSDENEVFFPQFTDPDAAVELEVTEFREATSDVYKFAVKKDDKGRWTIPSHGNYPADAKTRMGKAAAMMIGLKKDRVAGNRVDDHTQFQVIDPFDQKTAETKGRGRRITLKDKAGNVLADLIVGKDLEGRTDFHYVRVPDKKRVYACKFDNQLSTKFADWIETDLLKAQSWDVTQVVFDNYSVDEQAQEIVQGDRIVAKKDDSSKWTLEGLKDDEQSNEDKLREVGDTLGQLKIVGVRPKPEGLTAALKQANGIDRRLLAQYLAGQGYFLQRDGTLRSNEGDLLFQTRKGIRYTLRFGELVPGEGDAVTSGNVEPQAPKAKDGQQGPQPLPANNRYLMVTAEFDETLLKKPTGVKLAEDDLKKRQDARTQIEAIVKAVDAYKEKHDKKLPETLAQLCEKPAEGEPPLKELKKDPWEQDYQLQAQGETFAVVSFGADKASEGEAAAQDVRSDQFAKEDELKRAADEWKEYDRKVEDGKKEAGNLARRFGPWYYVIDKTLFDKLKPQRKDLVKPKDKPATTPPAPGNGEPSKVEPGK